MTTKQAIKIVADHQRQEIKDGIPHNTLDVAITCLVSAARKYVSLRNNKKQ